MAYRSRGRRYSARRTYRSAPRSSYRSRTRRRGTRVRSRGRAARVVIQVVGGAGGVAASPLSLGQKAARPVKARY